MAATKGCAQWPLLYFAFLALCEKVPQPMEQVKDEPKGQGGQEDKG